jgi:carbohydrate-binding DOMON domain-containing protein
LGQNRATKALTVKTQTLTNKERQNRATKALTVKTQTLTNKQRQNRATKALTVNPNSVALFCLSLFVRVWVNCQRFGCSVLSFFVC